MMTLFDLEPYGGNTPTPREARLAKNLERRTTPRPSGGSEPLADGWVLIRNSQGVEGYSHLIRSTTAHGAAATHCGRLGTVLSVDGITQMIRCPECAEA